MAKAEEVLSKASRSPEIAVAVSVQFESNGYGTSECAWTERTANLGEMAGRTLAVRIRWRGEAPGWLPKVLADIHQALSLPAKWDSYSARPVEVTAAARAIDVLGKIMRPATSAPHVVPTSRGGIQLEWTTTDIDLEIDISPEGEVEVCFEDFGSGEEWERTLDNDLSALVPIVSRLASS
jgi:hypothetical protein